MAPCHSQLDRGVTGRRRRWNALLGTLRSRQWIQPHSDGAGWGRAMAIPYREFRRVAFRRSRWNYLPWRRRQRVVSVEHGRLAKVAIPCRCWRFIITGHWAGWHNLLWYIPRREPVRVDAGWRPCMEIQHGRRNSFIAGCWARWDNLHRVRRPVPLRGQLRRNSKMALRDW